MGFVGSDLLHKPTPNHSSEYDFNKLHLGLP